MVSYRLPEPKRYAVSEEKRRLMHEAKDGFARTWLGTTTGFDPTGDTTSLILWLEGQGIWVDPSHEALGYMDQLGITEQDVPYIFLTHVHQDHDGGVLQRILLGQQVTLIASSVVYRELLRKAELFLKFNGGPEAGTPPDVKKLVNWIRLDPAKPLKLKLRHGGVATLKSWWNLHTIPTNGLAVTYQAEGSDKSFTYAHSSDNQWGRAYPGRAYRQAGIAENAFTIEKNLRDTKVISPREARRQQYRFFTRDGRMRKGIDHVDHEVGGVPIHTTIDQLAALGPEARRQITLYHVSDKAIADYNEGHPSAQLHKAGMFETDVFVPADTAKKKQYLLSILVSNALLRGKSEDFLRVFQNLAVHEEFPKGREVIVQGSSVKITSVPGLAAISQDRPDEDQGNMYFILSGRAGVYVNGEKKTELTPGSHFGEMSIVTGEPRSATIMAEEPLDVYRLSARDFLALFGDEATERRVRWLRENINFLTDWVAQSRLIFRDLPNFALGVLADEVQERSFNPGEKIISEGTEGDEFFIVKEGEIEIFKEAAPLEVLVNGGPGYHFGEISLLRNVKRTASVRAKSAVKVLALSRATFQNFVRHYPAVFVRLDHATEARLLDMSERYLSDPSVSRWLGGREASVAAMRALGARFGWHNAHELLSQLERVVREKTPDELNRLWGIGFGEFRADSKNQTFFIEQTETALANVPDGTLKIILNQSAGPVNAAWAAELYRVLAPGGILLFANGGHPETMEDLKASGFQITAVAADLYDARKPASREEAVGLHLKYLGIEPSKIAPPAKPEPSMNKAWTFPPDFVERHIEKVQTLAATLQESVGIHVMPSANLALFRPSDSYSGTAYVINPEWMRAEHMDSDREKARQFLEAFAGTFLSSFFLGFDSKQNGTKTEPSVPVALFVRTGQHGQVPTHGQFFARDHIRLHPQSRALFEERLAKAVTFPFEEIHQVELGELAQKITAAYLDSLLEIAKAARIKPVSLIWRRILAENQVPMDGTVVEVAPGYETKIGDALALLNFRGTIILVEPDPAAADAIEQAYRRILPEATVRVVKKPLAEIAIGTDIPARVDALVANHPFDDMALAAAMKGRMPSLFSQERADGETVSPDVRELYDNISDKDYIQGILATFKEWQDFVQQLKPAYFIASQYPSRKLELKGLARRQQSGFIVEELLREFYEGYLKEHYETRSFARQGDPAFWIIAREPFMDLGHELTKKPQALDRLGESIFVPQNTRRLNSDEYHMAYLDRAYFKSAGYGDDVGDAAKNFAIAVERDVAPDAAHFTTYADRQRDATDISLGGNGGSGRAVYIGSNYNVMGGGRTTLCTTNLPSHRSGRLDSLGAFRRVILSQWINSRTMRAPEHPLVMMLNETDNFKWSPTPVPLALLVRVDRGALDRPNHVEFSPQIAVDFWNVLTEYAKIDAEYFAHRLMMGAWSTGNYSLSGHMIDLETASFVRFRGPYSTASTKYADNFFGYESAGFIKILKQLARAKGLSAAETETIEKRFYEVRQKHLAYSFLLLLGFDEKSASAVLEKHPDEVMALAGEFERLAKKISPKKTSLNLYGIVPESEDPALLDMSRLFRNLAKLEKSPADRLEKALTLLVRQSALDQVASGAVYEPGLTSKGKVNQGEVFIKERAVITPEKLDDFMTATQNFIAGLFRLMDQTKTEALLPAEPDWEKRLSFMNQDFPPMGELNEKLKYWIEEYRLGKIGSETLGLEVERLSRMPDYPSGENYDFEDTPLIKYLNLKPGVLKDLARSFKVVDFAPGEEIIRQDDRPDALYFLVQGTVRFIVNGTARGTLSHRGAMVGEAAVLGSDGQRAASVIAEEPTRLLKIDKADLEKVLGAYPDLKRVLVNVLRQKKFGAAHRVLNLEVFSGTDAEELRLFFADKAVEKNFNAGDTLIRQGEEADGVYFLTGGAVVLSQTGTGLKTEPIQLGDGPLKAGSFGEQSVLFGTPAANTVTASEPVTVLFLSRQNFAELLDRYPGLLRNFLAHISEYMESNREQISAVAAMEEKLNGEVKDHESRPNQESGPSVRRSEIRNHQGEWYEDEQIYRQILRKKIKGRPRLFLSDEGRTFQQVSLIKGTNLVEKSLGSRKADVARRIKSEALHVVLAHERLAGLAARTYVFKFKLIQEYVEVLLSLKYPGRGLLWNVPEEMGQKLLDAWIALPEKLYQRNIFDIDLGIHNTGINLFGHLVGFDFGFMQSDYPGSIELNGAKKVFIDMIDRVPPWLRQYCADLVGPMTESMFQIFSNPDNSVWGYDFKQGEKIPHLGWPLLDEASYLANHTAGPFIDLVRHVRPAQGRFFGAPQFPARSETRTDHGPSREESYAEFYTLFKKLREVQSPDELAALEKQLIRHPFVALLDIPVKKDETTGALTFEIAANSILVRHDVGEDNAESQNLPMLWKYKGLVEATVHGKPAPVEGKRILLETLNKPLREKFAKTKWLTVHRPEQFADLAKKLQIQKVVLRDRGLIDYIMRREEEKPSSDQRSEMRLPEDSGKFQFRFAPEGGTVEFTMPKYTISIDRFGGYNVKAREGHFPELQKMLEEDVFNEIDQALARTWDKAEIAERPELESIARLWNQFRGRRKLAEILWVRPSERMIQAWPGRSFRINFRSSEIMIYADGRRLQQSAYTPGDPDVIATDEHLKFLEQAAEILARDPETAEIWKENIKRREEVKQAFGVDPEYLPEISYGGEALSIRREEKGNWGFMRRSHWRFTKDGKLIKDNQEIPPGKDKEISEVIDFIDQVIAKGSQDGPGQFWFQLYPEIKPLWDEIKRRRQYVRDLGQEDFTALPKIEERKLHWYFRYPVPDTYRFLPVTADPRTGIILINQNRLPTAKEMEFIQDKFEKVIRVNDPEIYAMWQEALRKKAEIIKVTGRDPFYLPQMIGDQVFWLTMPDGYRYTITTDQRIARSKLESMGSSDEKRPQLTLDKLTEINDTIQAAKTFVPQALKIWEQNLKSNMRAIELGYGSLADLPYLNAHTSGGYGELVIPLASGNVLFLRKDGGAELQISGTGKRTKQNINLNDYEDEIEQALKDEIAIFGNERKETPLGFYREARLKRSRITEFGSVTPETMPRLTKRRQYSRLRPDEEIYRDVLRVPLVRDREALIYANGLIEVDFLTYRDEDQAILDEIEARLEKAGDLPAAYMNPVREFWEEAKAQFIALRLHDFMSPEDLPFMLTGVSTHEFFNRIDIPEAIIIPVKKLVYENVIINTDGKKLVNGKWVGIPAREMDIYYEIMERAIQLSPELRDRWIVTYDHWEPAEETEDDSESGGGGASFGNGTKKPGRILQLAYMKSLLASDQLPKRIETLIPRILELRSLTKSDKLKRLREVPAESKIKKELPAVRSEARPVKPIQLFYIRHFGERSFQQAIPFLDKVIAEAPRNPDQFPNVIWLLEAEGANVPLMVFRTLAKLGPENAVAWNWWNKALASRDDVDFARITLEEYRTNPDFRDLADLTRKKLMESFASKLLPPSSLKDYAKFPQTGGQASFMKMMIDYFIDKKVPYAVFENGSFESELLNMTAFSYDERFEKAFLAGDSTGVMKNAEAYYRFHYDAVRKRDEALNKQFQELRQKYPQAVIVHLRGYNHRDYEDLIRQGLGDDFAASEVDSEKAFRLTGSKFFSGAKNEFDIQRRLFLILLCNDFLSHVPDKEDRNEVLKKMEQTVMAIPDEEIEGWISTFVQKTASEAGRLSERIRSLAGSILERLGFKSMIESNSDRIARSGLSVLKQLGFMSPEVHQKGVQAMSLSKKRVHRSETREQPDRKRNRLPADYLFGMRDRIRAKKPPVALLKIGPQDERMPLRLTLAAGDIFQMANYYFQVLHISKEGHVLLLFSRDRKKPEAKGLLIKIKPEQLQNGNRVTFGRSKQSRIIIHSPNVSRHQAELYSENGALCLAQKGRINAVKVYRPHLKIAVQEKLTPKRVPAEGSAVQIGDVVRIEQQLLQVLTVSDAGILLLHEDRSAEHKDRGLHFLRWPQNSELTIGREIKNSIVLNHPSISRHHAVLSWKEGKLTLRDMDSSAGTYLYSRSEVRQWLPSAEEQAILDRLRLRLDPETGRIYYRDDFKPFALNADVWLTRHGETHNIKQALETKQRAFQGASNLPVNELSPLGHRQADDLGDILFDQFQADLTSDGNLVLLRSPLKRTEQTAEPFLKKAETELGRRPHLTVDPGLIEMSFGIWDNKTEAAILEKYGEDELEKVRANRNFNALARAPDGESFISVLGRAHEFLKSLNEKYGGKRIILFGHGTFFSALRILMHDPDMSPDGFLDWRKNMTSLAKPFHLNTAGAEKFPRSEIRRIALPTENRDRQTALAIGNGRTPLAELVAETVRQYKIEIDKLQEATWLAGSNVRSIYSFPGQSIKTFHTVSGEILEEKAKLASEIIVPAATVVLIHFQRSEVRTSRKTTTLTKQRKLAKAAASLHRIVNHKVPVIEENPELGRIVDVREVMKRVQGPWQIHALAREITSVENVAFHLHLNETELKEHLEMRTRDLGKLPPGLVWFAFVDPSGRIRGFIDAKPNPTASQYKLTEFATAKQDDDISGRGIFLLDCMFRALEKQGVRFLEWDASGESIPFYEWYLAGAGFRDFHPVEKDGTVIDRHQFFVDLSSKRLQAHRAVSRAEVRTGEDAPLGIDLDWERAVWHGEPENEREAIESLLRQVLRKAVPAISEDGGREKIYDVRINGEIEWQLNFDFKAGLMKVFEYSVSDGISKHLVDLPFTNLAVERIVKAEQEDAIVEIDHFTDAIGRDLRVEFQARDRDGFTEANPLVYRVLGPDNEIVEDWQLAAGIYSPQTFDTTAIGARFDYDGRRYQLTFHPREFSVKIRPIFAQTVERLLELVPRFDLYPPELSETFIPRASLLARKESLLRELSDHDAAMLGEASRRTSQRVQAVIGNDFEVLEEAVRQLEEDVKLLQMVRLQPLLKRLGDGIDTWQAEWVKSRAKTDAEHEDSEVDVYTLEGELENYGKIKVTVFLSHFAGRPADWDKIIVEETVQGETATSEFENGLNESRNGSEILEWVQYPARSEVRENSDERIELTTKEPYEVTLEKLGPNSWKAESGRGVFQFDLIEATPETAPVYQPLLAQFFIAEQMEEEAKAEHLAKLNFFSEDDPSQLILCVTGGKVVGFYSFNPASRWLNGIYVMTNYPEEQPNFRGSGAADVLLEDLSRRFFAGDPTAKFEAKIARSSSRATHGHFEGSINDFRFKLGMNSIVTIKDSSESVIPGTSETKGEVRSEGRTAALRIYVQSFLKQATHREIFEQNVEDIARALEDPARLVLPLRPVGQRAMQETMNWDSIRQWFLGTGDRFSARHRDFLNQMDESMLKDLFRAKFLQGPRENQLRNFLVSTLKGSARLSSQEHAFLDGLEPGKRLDEQGVEIVSVRDFSSARAMDEGTLIYRLELTRNGVSIRIFLKGEGIYWKRWVKHQSGFDRKTEWYESYTYQMLELLEFPVAAARYYEETQSQDPWLGFTLIQEIPGVESAQLLDLQTSGRFYVRPEYTQHRAQLISELARYNAVFDLLHKGDRKLINSKSYPANYIVDLSFLGAGREPGAPAALKPLDHNKLFNKTNQSPEDDLKKFGTPELGILAAFRDFDDPSGRQALFGEYKRAYLEMWHRMRAKQTSLLDLTRDIFGPDSFEYDLLSRNLKQDPEVLFEAQQAALLEFVEKNHSPDPGSVRSEKREIVFNPSEDYSELAKDLDIFLSRHESDLAQNRDFAFMLGRALWKRYLIERFFDAAPLRPTSEYRKLMNEDSPRNHIRNAYINQIIIPDLRKRSPAFESYLQKNYQMDHVIGVSCLYTITGKLLTDQPELARRFVDVLSKIATEGAGVTANGDQLPKQISEDLARQPISREVLEKVRANAPKAESLLEFQFPSEWQDALVFCLIDSFKPVYEIQKTRPVYVNRRLAGLGDALLEQWLAEETGEWIRRRQIDPSLAEMDKDAFLHLLSNKVLNVVAQNTELFSLVSKYWPKGGTPRSLEQQRGNSVEAVFAAVYLAAGWPAMKQVARHLFAQGLLVGEEFDFAKIIQKMQVNRSEVRRADEKDAQATVQATQILFREAQAAVSEGLASQHKTGLPFGNEKLMRIFFARLAAHSETERAILFRTLERFFAEPAHTAVGDKQEDLSRLLLYYAARHQLLGKNVSADTKLAASQEGNSLLINRRSLIKLAGVLGIGLAASGPVGLGTLGAKAVSHELELAAKMSGFIDDLTGGIITELYQYTPWFRESEGGYARLRNIYASSDKLSLFELQSGNVLQHTTDLIKLALVRSRGVIAHHHERIYREEREHYEDVLRVLAEMAHLEMPVPIDPEELRSRVGSKFFNLLHFPGFKLWEVEDHQIRGIAQILRTAIAQITGITESMVHLSPAEIKTLGEKIRLSRGYEGVRSLQADFEKQLLALETQLEKIGARLKELQALEPFENISRGMRQVFLKESEELAKGKETLEAEKLSVQAKSELIKTVTETMERPILPSPVPVAGQTVLSRSEMRADEYEGPAFDFMGNLNPVLRERLRKVKLKNLILGKGRLMELSYAEMIKVLEEIDQNKIDVKDMVLIRKKDGREEIIAYLTETTAHQYGFLKPGASRHVSEHQASGSQTDSQNTPNRPARSEIRKAVVETKQAAQSIRRFARTQTARRGMRHASTHISQRMLEIRQKVTVFVDMRDFAAFPAEAREEFEKIGYLYRNYASFVFYNDKGPAPEEIRRQLETMQAELGINRIRVISSNGDFAFKNYAREKSIHISKNEQNADGEDFTRWAPKGKSFYFFRYGERDYGLLAAALLYAVSDVKGIVKRGKFYVLVSQRLRREIQQFMASLVIARAA